MSATRDNRNAKNAQTLPAGERREAARRVFDKAGKPELVRLFDFREPTAEESAFAKTLEPMAKRVLSRGNREVA